MSELLTSVQVLICTKDRPESLLRLLTALSLESCDAPLLDLTCLVLDNGTISLADEQLAGLGMRIRTVAQLCSGIASARNAALHAASKDVEYWAFIDDDEYPGDGWLAQLLDTAASTHGDLIGGPVLPDFEGRTSWLIDDPLFRHTQLLSPEQEAPYLATGNLLLRVEAWREAGSPLFDESLDRIGGEDTDFTSRLKLRGASLRWEANAVVFEVIPQARLNVRWVLWRSVWSGYSRQTYLRRATAARYRIALSPVKHLLLALLFGLRVLVGPDRRKQLLASAKAAAHVVGAALCTVHVPIRFYGSP